MKKRINILIIKISILLVFVLGTEPSFSQSKYKLTGTVLDIQDNPVGGAKVYVKDDYEFVYSALNGKFEITVTDTGTYVVVAESMGYVPVEVQITVLATGINTGVVKFNAKEARNLQNVTVRSSKLAATNDKSKSVVLNRLDVLTTAGANADITSALKTLPGTQQAVAEDGLFVRGGSGRETKAYVDGMRSSNFYYSGAPGVSHRGRFPASLFKGTYFTSGGYSAQYGQALSSVIVLETEDLPEKSSVDFNAGTAGLGGTANILSKDAKTSYGGTINFLDMKYYYGLVKQKYDFTDMPMFLDGSIFFRRKIGKKGILKFYASQATSKLALYRQNIDYDYRKDYYNLRNLNSYTNLSYNTSLKKDWSLESAISFSSNEDRYKLAEVDSDIPVMYKDSTDKNSSFQGRVTIKKNLSAKVNFLTGAEFERYSKNYDKKSLLSTASADYKDFYSAAFSEVNIKATTKLNLRLGLRGENSSQLLRPAIAPRAMIDYNFVKDYHVSFNYGQFYQSPEEDLLYTVDKMRFQKATHYIASFQKVKRNVYTFRTEAFYKKYDRLTLFGADTTQAGYGYAKGFELFWRHKLNDENLEYWISYSYLDSKRKYLDYPTAVQPYFVSNHAASAVIKRYFDKISTHIALSYSYESGKPYYNPQKGLNDFLKDRTPAFQTVNLSVAYVRNIKKVYSIFVFTLSNAFNQKQVFGYRYSDIDYSRREALTPLAPRFFFLGAFFNIGIDRTKDNFNSSIE